MRRSAALIGLSALVAVVCSGCASAPSRMTAAAAGHRGSAGYVDSRGWSLRYPDSLSLERSTSGPGEVTFTEVTIANFAPRRGVVSGKTRDGGFIRVRPPLDSAGRFPADGVAFRMLSVDGGPLFAGTGADSRFPISPATLTRPQQRSFAAAAYARLGLPAERVRQVLADGQRYTAELFVGRSSTPLERAKIYSVARSLAFRRLRPGQRAGDEQVIGLAQDYPVGSFTLVHAAGDVCDGTLSTCHSGEAPFYLVHAPGRLHEPDLIQPCDPVRGACTPAGAFYAIGWKWEVRSGGYRSACDLRVDRATGQFYCTNSSARWDRVGDVIRRPRGARFGEPLQFTFAKVTWDGHVILIPGLDENPPRDASRTLLWPGARWR